MSKEVIIMVGISGAGKTTAIKDLSYRYPRLKVCSADLFFCDDNGCYNFDPAKLSEAHNYCMRNFLEAMANGSNAVVVDNTNCSIAEIAPYVAVANAFGYFTKIIVVHAEPKDCIERNTHGTPANAIMGQHYRLQKTLADLPPWWNVEHRWSD